MKYILMFTVMTALHSTITKEFITQEECERAAKELKQELAEEDYRIRSIYYCAEKR